MKGTNWIGLWTLYRREVRRFLSVSAQTVAGPVVGSILLLIVLAAVLQSRASATEGYLSFVAAGIVIMAVAQNAFANTSSSILVAKLQGNISDLLLAPLSPLEMLVGFALGAVTRGLVVGTAVALAVWPFVSIPMPVPSHVLFYGFGGALIFALLGIIAGLWANKMDEQAAVTNFVIAPLTLLSGTFFSVEALPPAYQYVARLDPFLYVVDGFRGGFSGVAEESAALAVAIVVAANGVLLGVCHRLLRTGWRLRH